ncbi:MAG: hypothetical protein M2R45_02249 [Verrucomicrobia subdivision 3 bacterium]|nr:hypothetical protein [Limisphaerales bacterium]MCS1413965.1 hypothetical protein [Limisphaerales bacterium]
MLEKETDPKKVRFAPFFFHDTNRLCGNHPVGLLRVITIGRKPTQSGRDLSVSFRVEDQMFFGFILLSQIRRPLPRRRIVKPIGPNT